MIGEGFHITQATAPNPGAVAIIQLDGSGAPGALAKLTGVNDWPVGRVRLVSFKGIDEGLAVVLREGDSALAQVMPHGGLRVVGKIVERLMVLGGGPATTASATAVYPEAASALEADMLATMSRAASPAAIDLLAAQSRLWTRWLKEHEGGRGETDAVERERILARGDVLDRLVHPPMVVVMGRPNVGKSTLTNRLTGRTASIVADLPGTTRDWVGAVVTLGSVAVQWIDTPGVRESEDAIERSAIELSRQVIEQADVLIAMRDREVGFAAMSGLKRRPDLWLKNKVDDESGALEGDGASAESPVAISALNGLGLDRLGRLVLKRLGLAELGREEMWAFSRTLREVMRRDDLETMFGYAQGLA